MIDPEVIRQHYGYNEWATKRLLQAAAGLTEIEVLHDFRTADRSVLGTFQHLFGSETLWLARFQGRPADQRPASPASIAGLQEGWLRLAADWNAWAAALTRDSLRADVTYSDLRGNRWTQPLWQPALHVVNHSTHHRGQIAGFLRALGKTPPPLDLVAYQRGI